MSDKNINQEKHPEKKPTAQEDKIYEDAGAKKIIEGDGCCTPKKSKPIEHSDDDGHDHEYSDSEKSTFQMFLPAIISLIVLFSGIAMDYFLPQEWFKDWVRILWYAVAYIPVGLPVLKEAFESITKGDVFSEFFLMSIATVGAFAIGEYPEGVAVMLFIALGKSSKLWPFQELKVILKHY